MKGNLQEKGLRPASDLAEGRPHGDRLKYLAGCKCMLCRAANSRYETSRAAARKAGDWNGIVSAKRARSHILKLSRAGVGRYTLSEAADVGATIIQDIRSGRKKRIRKRTEARILSVTAAAVAGGALVPAGPTWRRINILIENGFTRAEIARRLGYRRPALQLNKDFVTAKNAAAVERLYNRVMK